jgi:hypothetical protein
MTFWLSVRGMRTILGLIFSEFDQCVRRLIAECGGQVGVRLKNFVLHKVKNLIDFLVLGFGEEADLPEILAAK